MAFPQFVILSADTVSTVDLADVCAGSTKRVRVTSDGADTEWVFLRGDGTAPTVRGAGCQFLLGGSPGYVDVDVRPLFENGNVTSATLKIISHGTPTVAIEVID